jgi:uncharacterized protein (DUF2345 family)
MASAFSVRSQNKTDLVPNSLVGNNDSKFISMTPNLGINFYDSVSTILASISWNGISTNNPNGFDIQSPLNMNNNNINNVNTISGVTGNALTISSDDILYINTGNNTQINAVSSFTATAGDNIILKASNDAMTLSADDDITLTSGAKGIILNGGSGDGGNNDITLKTIDGTPSGGSIGNIVLDSSGNITLYSSGNNITLDSSNNNITLDSSGNINLTASTGNGKIYANSDIIIVDANEPTWITTLETGRLKFDISGNYLVTIDADGGGVISCIDNTGVNTLYSSMSPGILQVDNGTIVNTITPSSIISNSIFSVTANDNLDLISDNSNINLTASTGNGKIIANSDIRMVDAAEPTWITTLEAGSLSFDISGNSVKKYVVIDADGGANIQVSINDNGIESYSSLMPNKLTLGYQANSFTINHDTSNNLILDCLDNMILQADDDITLTSNTKGIILNGGSGDDGNNDITLTTQNSTSVGNINLDSAGIINLNAGSDITLDASGNVVNILSNLNMNDNDINNINTINGTSNLTLSGSDIYTNTQGLQLNAGTYINLDCNNGNINLTTQSNSGEIYITSGASIHLNPNPSVGGTTNIVGGMLNDNFNVNGFQLNECNSINTTSGFTLNDTGGAVVLNSTGDINLTAPTGNINLTSSGKTYINFTTPNTGDGELVCANISYVNDININSSGGFIYLTAPNDINLSSNGKTYINLSGVSTGDGELVCSTYSSVGDLSISALSGGVVSLNSGDNTQITCGENFLVNTNGTTGVVGFSTGNIPNSGGVKWNNYLMGITFFNKWQGTFTYSNTANWEMVKQNIMEFPSQFLYGTWAVQFSINCHNVGSAPQDKEMGMYFNFKDANGTIYDGFSYNYTTPFAQYFNASNYTNTSLTPLSITYTDYFDFGDSATNNLELQINWYGFGSYNQDFNVSTTFTLANELRSL